MLEFLNYAVGTLTFLGLLTVTIMTIEAYLGGEFVVEVGE